MAKFTIIPYNIKYMNKMFENNIIKSKDEKRTQIADVIKYINLHVLEISKDSVNVKEKDSAVGTHFPVYCKIETDLMKEQISRSGCDMPLSIYIKY